MQARKTSLQQDMGLRLAGISLIGASWFGVRLLSRVVNLPPEHEATMAEMGVAAASFLGATSGVALSVIGAHIFDPVPLSALWVSAPDHHVKNERRRAALFPSRSTQRRTDGVISSKTTSANSQSSHALP